MINNDDATEETELKVAERGPPEANVSNPRSLVAIQKDHSKRDAAIGKCCNLSYDVLTIVISIADVTTDIMVLISYYMLGRMTFFYVSLAILLVAQIGYLIVFFLGFDIDDMIAKIQDLLYKLCCCDGKLLECWCCRGCDPDNSENKCCKCLLISFFVTIFVSSIVIALLCLLPFGHLVSFLMYFLANEESAFTKCLAKRIGIKKRANIPMEERLNEMAKFTIEKINKHGGFILEAFLEALPQSILQLVAMVYFQETNVVSVCSIILSMTSIMSKSLVLSQGAEWKSYFFCWLCVCTDFFSIFFVVSWIFLSNDYISGSFLGHFSVIGQVWIYKVAITILPPFVFVALCYVLVGFWCLLYALYKENTGHGQKWWEAPLFIVLFVTCGNAVIVFLYAIGVIIGVLLFEIICFTMTAVWIFVFFTIDRWDYSSTKTGNVIKALLSFIGDGAAFKNNDRMIRIVAINYAYFKHNKNNGDALVKYIENEHREETLHKVSYSDLRNHCMKPKKANFFQTLWKGYGELMGYFVKESIPKFTGTPNFKHFTQTCLELAALLMIYLSLPLYLLGRIATVLYPYFIIGYVSWYGLWTKLHVFELTMLGIYVGLQCIIFIFGFFVLRTHLWLWHILPGTSDGGMNWPADMKPFWKKCFGFYDSCQWFPVIKEILMRRFGDDVGLIIADYVKAINDEEFKDEELEI